MEPAFPSQCSGEVHNAFALGGADWLQTGKRQRAELGPQEELSLGRGHRPPEVSALTDVPELNLDTRVARMLQSLTRQLCTKYLLHAEWGCGGWGVRGGGGWHRSEENTKIPSLFSSSLPSSSPKLLIKWLCAWPSVRSCWTRLCTEVL